MINIVFWVLMSFLAGGIGSFFTTPAIPTWYATLKKPIFNPPNWIFGPVWSILYLLMGIVMGIIANTKAEKPIKLKAYKLFVSQLILNSLWSIIFFGLKLPWFAFIEIIILLTIVEKFQHQI